MANTKLVSTKGSGLSEYIKRIEGLQKWPVTVGVHKKEGNHENSNLTVAQIAAYNEFGTENTPERSFIRSTMRENRIKYILTMSEMVKRISAGGHTYKNAMGKIGMMVQNDIQSKIVNLKTPPNAESTIKKKESSNPLVDTGQLVSSIRWEYSNNDN